MSDAFLAIVQRTEGELRGYIAAWGIQLCDVDDLAQTVYLDYFRAQDRRPAEVEVVVWLKGIARNHCRHHLRGKGRHAARLAEIGEALDAAASGALADRAGAGLDLAESLQICLQRVPAVQRSLFQRFYVDGIDAATLAGETRQTPSGVRMAMLRLRSALRRCILARQA